MPNKHCYFFYFKGIPMEFFNLPLFLAVFRSVLLSPKMWYKRRRRNIVAPKDDHSGTLSDPP